LAFAVNETDKGSYFWVDDVQHLPEGLPAMRLKFNANLRDTVFKPYFDEEQSKKALDRINLLYVATTRAENALYIISRKKAGESVGWASYLKSFCQQQPDFNGVFYEWGDSHHTKSDNGKSSAKQNHPARSQAYSIGNWHLKIDLNSKIFQAFDSDAIRLGNLMHTALSWIKTPSDFDTAMQRLNASAMASEKELAEVKYRLEILLNNDTIKPIFNDFDAVYIERNILLSTGAVLRPDRVVVKEKATTIVEFKTGVFDEKHILQTKEYLTVLKSMQPENNLKALLIYLGDTPECIAVE
jgi:ATP-dependent exoDNAse (exonuclease V) beta subunit